MVFIESPTFSRRLHSLAGEYADEVLRAMQADLLYSPLRGKLVPGLGIRKGRCANPARGKGKRGGCRYLYLYLARRDHIHLLYLLDKDEQEDLSAAQRVLLRRLAEDV